MMFILQFFSNHKCIPPAVGNTGSRGYSNSVGYSYSGEVTSDVYPVQYPA